MDWRRGWDSDLRRRRKALRLPEPIRDPVPSGENLVHQLQVIDSKRLKSDIGGHTTCRCRIACVDRNHYVATSFLLGGGFKFAEPHLANKRAAARISAAVATASGSAPRPGDWTTPFGARSQDPPAWPGVSESTPPRPRRGPAPRSSLSVTEDPTVLSRRAGLASSARS
jgi:hypothetical protein